MMGSSVSGRSNGGESLTGSSESLPLSTGTRSYRSYGSLFNYYGFLKKGLSTSSKTLNRSDSMVSLSHRALAGYILEDDFHGFQAFLANKRVLVDDRDENGATALHLAASKGKLNFLRELLSHGADVNSEDNDNWTALLCAAKEGHTEVCIELLERDANIEHRDMGGWTALMWASYRGHTVTVLMLVERGADVNAHGNYHISSLLWAAGRGHAEIAKILVQHGAKVNVGDKYGTTALVWASRKGNAEIVDCLLKAGANVDTAGMCDRAILYDELNRSNKMLSLEYSWTPLLVATMGNHVDVVTLLLECKPNVNAVDKDGCTALTIACKEGYTEIATSLLNIGAYINIQDRSGDTNLIHAVKGGHRSVVEALLKKYADVDIPGKERKTATYNAVEKGNIPILRILLTSNPDLEVATKDGDTALLRAVRSRNTEAVQLLLERKARVSACDRWGDTALHVAMRARSKAIVEILLRNPKNSQLLYRPNRAGETPYNIDMNHPKTILGQIFGARRLNTNEDNENLLGYDLYSSALADMLSEPSLSMPITVGLYAKWGSGKSFLLNKLREEMQNFARQWVEPMVQFSWLLMAILAHFSVVFGLAVGLASSSWMIGVTSAATAFALIYFFLLLLWYGSQRYNWDVVYNMSVALTYKMNAIRVVLQVIFCHPPGAQWSDTITAQPIRFYFTDQTRVGSTAAGENSVVQMIGSLYDSIEADYGTLSTRLYRAFRPKPLKSTSSWRWRRFCCIPDIVMFEICFVCVLVLIAVLTIYLMELHLPASNVSIDRMTAHIVFGICGTLVLMSVVANIYTVTCVLTSVVMSQRHHLQRAIAHVDTVKSEGFLQALRSEVNLMKDMVKCLDAFSQQQTRLVVIVDGLDSCEQDKVLLVLDAVHVLFSDTTTPFIIILAIDPHIISKAVEANSRRLLSESNIGGHDYLRNMVHLPFFLQNSGLRKLKMAQKSATKKSQTAAYDTLADVGLVRSGSARRLSSNEAMLSRSQERLKVAGGGSGKGGGSGGGSSSGLKRLKLSDSIASSLGSNLNRAGGPHDLTKMLLTDDYFSDVNPRSMRRLMNVVYITGRLLKAFQIDFNWYHLASWINITEQWPYRTSWLILYHDSAEDSVEDNMSLKTLYDKVRCHIPVSKDIEPLLELDRDERKLDIFLTFHRSNLLVGDLRIFLPFTINLDPYIKKVIKEEQQNMDDSFLTGSQGQGPILSSPGTTSMWAQQSPDTAWSLYRKSPLTRKQSMKCLQKRLATNGITPVHQMSQLVCQTQQQQPPPHPQWQVMTPASTTVVQPPLSSASMMMMGGGLYSPAPSPPPLPPELDEVQLEGLSVGGVCDVVSKLTDLQQSQVPQYIGYLQGNNINGKVLMHCELNELKQVLNMSFGDWEIFRIVLLRLREAALARRRLGSSAPPSVAPTPNTNRNVRFVGSTSSNKLQQQNMAPPSTSEKERSVTKQSIMEKQVTLEEQMICGALQTLNEEACEDVLEENKDIRQEQGEVLTFDRFGRVPSQTSCYSYNPNDEMDMILLQCLPAGPTQWVATAGSGACGSSSPCSSAGDTPIVLRKKHEQPPLQGGGSEVKLAVSSLPSSRPSSLLMSLIGHAPATRSLSADDERTQSKSWNSSFWNSDSHQKGLSMLSGLTASLRRNMAADGIGNGGSGGSNRGGGGSGDESTPLVSEHSSGGGSLSPPSSISSPSTPLGSSAPHQVTTLHQHQNHCSTSSSSSSVESLNAVLSAGEENNCYSRGGGQETVVSPRGRTRPPSLPRQYAIDIDEESPLMPQWNLDPETTV